MGKRKDDCTPEEWERILEAGRAAYQNNREARLQRNGEYNRRPDVKEKRRAYDMRPEVRARRQEREAQKGTAYRKNRWEKIKGDPDLLRAHYDKVRESRTGMTREIFDALLVAQDGKCAICAREFVSPHKGKRTSPQKDTPCADHCHDGNGPRGLICHACNIIEGRIRHSGLSLIEYTKRLHDYLLDPPVKKLPRP